MGAPERRARRGATRIRGPRAAGGAGGARRGCRRSAWLPGSRSRGGPGTGGAGRAGGEAAARGRDALPLSAPRASPSGAGGQRGAEPHGGPRAARKARDSRREDAPGAAAESFVRRRPRPPRWRRRPEGTRSRGARESREQGGSRWPAGLIRRRDGGTCSSSAPPEVGSGSAPAANGFAARRARPPPPPGPGPWRAASRFLLPRGLRSRAGDDGRGPGEGISLSARQSRDGRGPRQAAPREGLREGLPGPGECPPARSRLLCGSLSPGLDAAVRRPLPPFCQY
ncbi:uncharacterized protein [Manis javanica]|uniref:uncharacterized protein n=1 Tax=Manis javanica TaxID=9974 RepID=UPI003C6D8977